MIKEGTRNTVEYYERGGGKMEAKDASPPCKHSIRRTPSRVEENREGKRGKADHCYVSID